MYMHRHTNTGLSGAYQEHLSGGQKECTLDQGVLPRDGHPGCDGEPLP